MITSNTIVNDLLAILKKRYPNDALITHYSKDEHIIGKLMLIKEIESLINADTEEDYNES